MVAKGEIVAIPSQRPKVAGSTNTCDLRIPLFETVTDSGIVIIYDVQMAIQPGIQGGYRVGDMVWVGFESDKYEKPVVLGKLFLGSAAEVADFQDSSEERRGTIQQNALAIKNEAQLPSSTVFSNTPNKPSIPGAQLNPGLFTARQLCQELITLKDENRVLKQELEALKRRLNQINGLFGDTAL